MKILLCAPRHWTAGRRFRSLILNAPKLGHELKGLAADFEADQELTIAVFNELGIEAFPRQQWSQALSRFDPDVVFGEYINSDVERNVQAWVNKHGKVGLMNNHNPFVIPTSHWFFPPTWTHTYYLVTSQQQAEARATCYDATAPERNWPRERIFVIGASDLDYIMEPIHVKEVRQKLGVKPFQPLIGLFPTLVEQNVYNCLDYGEITSLVASCQDAGWQVVIHPHPMQRRLPNAEWPDGFYVYDDDLNGARFWPTIRDLGAKFIADYVPGKVCGIEFQRCQSYELIRTADCLIGSFDPFFEAYALGKEYHFLDSEAARLMERSPYNQVCDREFELQDNFTKVIRALEAGDNDLKQDPALIEQWFYALDGQWWKRALEVAEYLVLGGADWLSQA